VRELVPLTTSMADFLAPELPRTVQEAVECLLQTLGPAEKEAIVEKPEAELIDLHFGLGTRIRNEFGLWQGNHALRLDCQRIRFKDMANISDGLLVIHLDDASMVIIRALWSRLRY
jgi:hypothetical protein